MKRSNIHSPTISPLPTFNPELDFQPGLNDSDFADISDTLRFLPMVDLNLFPQLISNISVEESETMASFSQPGSNPYLALFTLKNLDVDPYNLRKEDFYPIGVAAKILEISAAQGKEPGNLRVTAQGLCRISLNEIMDGNSLVQVTRLVEQPEDPDNLLPLVLEAKRLFAETLKLIPGMAANLFKINRFLEGRPSVLADLIMASLPVKTRHKAEFLSIDDLSVRYQRLLEHLTMEIVSRKAGQAISARIETTLSNRYKEQQLREQLKAIKAELGEDDDSEDVVNLSNRLVERTLPEPVKSAADRELQRLRLTPPQSSEYATIRNYLEWLLELPWTEASQETNDLSRAREILERDHLGLDTAKKRILEFLAVHKLTNNLKAPILCLTGPPGVGKTSLGRSVAEALGRKFVRISLGGLRDEAEIRGHRRTYVGANPGRIVSSLRKCGVNNPVFLLDEIDKVGYGPTGDPSAALLEVLDPEQNDGFADNFLEVPFDLSNVLFILTANVMEDIPGPLRDRLEIVEISGYTVDEKIAIGHRHLWPKELIRHGLGSDEVRISDETLENIVSSYTWEAGCRDLSRRLGALARHRAMAKAEERLLPLDIAQEELKTVLGPPRRHEERREMKPQTGVVTGLAWTAAGGDLMFVEAVAMPGRGRLSLTGHLGEVMKESAQAAICYVRSRAHDWFLYDSWFQENDVHIHLPHGAIPKDGPSAGIALATAVVSLISGQKVRPEVAMTGEISLRGLVLAVGGLKEKLLAAKRAGLSTILIPADNLADLSEMNRSVLDGLKLVPVTTLDDVLEYALLPPEGMFESEAFNPGGEKKQPENAWKAALQFRAAKQTAQNCQADQTQPDLAAA
ncbi:MAG: endopeptidase La [Deltaproteobacteria bacterium]|jgi:ATP-dependent Lon protease|nr:endopeptidase La [Deltaproteobacteria bacterium]